MCKQERFIARTVARKASRAGPAAQPGTAPPKLPSGPDLEGEGGHAIIQPRQVLGRAQGDHAGVGGPGSLLAGLREKWGGMAVMRQ